MQWALNALNRFLRKWKDWKEMRSFSLIGLAQVLNLFDAWNN
jgi:hypothetical protein